ADDGTAGGWRGGPTRYRSVARFSPSAVDLKISHRWLILGVSVVAQMTTGIAFFPGLATIGPVIASWYHLDLVQVGILFGGMQFGPVLTVALWGAVADRMGDRFVLAAGRGA